MIRPADFEIDIGHDGDGVYVHVTHRPTGNVRHAGGVTEVGKTRDALVQELKAQVLQANDLRLELICEREIGWLRVTHMPTGLSATAENIGDQHAVVDRLTDEVLDELHASGELETGD